jgi:hypothetical protein
MVGVDHFYIYDDESGDNLRKILAPYIASGIVTYYLQANFKPTKFGCNKQLRSYNDAVSNFRNETKWMAFIDTDEFMVPLRHRTIPEFLEDYEDCTNITINWVFYGSGGHEKRKDGWVIERFKRHQSKAIEPYKSILNPRAVVYSHTHNSCTFGGSTNEKKERCSMLCPWPKALPSAEYIRINHYRVKSREEYAEKIQRHRGFSGVTPLDEKFFKECDRNEVYDDIMDQYVEKLNEKFPRPTAQRNA